jgi:hypothetical protein
MTRAKRASVNVQLATLAIPLARSSSKGPMSKLTKSHSSTLPHVASGASILASLIFCCLPAQSSLQQCSMRRRASSSISRERAGRARCLFPSCSCVRSDACERCSFRPSLLKKGTSSWFPAAMLPPPCCRFFVHFSAADSSLAASGNFLRFCSFSLQASSHAPFSFFHRQLICLVSHCSLLRITVSFMYEQQIAEHQRTLTADSEHIRSFDTDDRCCSDDGANDTVAFTHALPKSCDDSRLP